MPWVMEAARQLVSGETRSNRIQHRNYTKDRKVIWCDWFNSVVRNNEGKVVTVMSMVQDITRQRLEKLVEERTRELNEALKKEKELAELKSKFVSIASHEFRTPLSSISFAAESVRNYFHQLTAEEIKRKLIKIEELASHMTNLLEDILTVGKAEAGKIKVMRVSIDLREFIDSLIDEVKAPLKVSQQITLSFGCKQNKVNVDDKLLRNVIINLLTNALKFSPPDKPVVVTVTEDANNIFIEVKDYGIGIDPKDLSSIFEAFHRGSNVSTVQGTGLGLSILRKSIDMMGGTVTVDSTLNVGSTFKVSIPIK
jgi:signal transduction histidine kinase